MSDVMQTIRATVIMPAYNAERYVREAIESILNQTFTQFELLVINDGSTDNTENIVRSFTDKRIKYLANEKNIGLIATLNKGLKLTDADYIIRMDADDISLPQRIEKQIRFMDENPGIVASGTNIRYFGLSTETSNIALDNTSLKTKLLFYSCFAHPSVIIRNATVKSYGLAYHPDFYMIEDYELWTELARYGELANLGEVLLLYRWEGQNITAGNWEKRLIKYQLIYTKILGMLQIPATEENIRLHLELGFHIPTIEAVEPLFLYREKLLAQNRIHKHYDEKSLQEFLDTLCARIFYKCADQGLKYIWQYYRYGGKFKLSHLKLILKRCFYPAKSKT